MSNFHIGQKVVCVDASVAWDGDDRLRVGSVYTIRGFDPDTGGLGVLLEELVSPIVAPWEHELSWDPSRFRPVGTTDISIFTAMLAPTPREKVRA